MREIITDLSSRLSLADIRQAQQSINELLEDSRTHGDNPNFSILTDGEEYQLYFRHLVRVSKIILAYYQKQSNLDTLEAQTVGDFMTRLINTINCLCLKYTYNSEHRLRVDLTASGFPNWVEINELATDFGLCNERLLDSDSLSILKAQDLKYLFATRRDSPEILQALGERSYLEMLKKFQDNKLFFPFTPGQLINRKSKENQVRSYVFSWACYDVVSNRPYIYIMAFEQDATAEPLENPESNGYKEFLNVIRNEGSQAPQIGLFAMLLDEQLANIHPKMVKRIDLGPLYSLFLFDNAIIINDPWQKTFEPLLKQFGQKPDDFILLLEDETVISKEQRLSRTLLTKRVREIYQIPESDLECYRRHASVIHRYALMPHYLRQHVEDNKELLALGFGDYQKITFTQEDEINGG
ncbi:MAG: hypothetical protein WCT16_05065 [Candidatus Buchananbacteria bacterium]